MKLLRLKINSKFRSLPKGFELYFLRDFDYKDADDFNPYIFAGRNGSGKSNVLEALAEIFYHLDIIYLSNKPTYFEKKGESYTRQQFFNINLRIAKIYPETEKGFIKAPFLAACKQTGIFDDQEV